MESKDFNDMPKDAMMLIGDMSNFVEFIAFNSIKKAVNKLMYSLFDRHTYATKLIEKYIARYNVKLREYAEKEAKRFIVKSIKVDGEDDVGEEFFNELGAIGQIKRGDIDRVVLLATNDILFKILEDMSKDKLVKLCWDAESDDFVWVLRKPNEPDKIETKYKQPKKRINKKQK